MPPVIALRRHFFICRYQKPSPSAGSAFRKTVPRNYSKTKTEKTEYKTTIILNIFRLIFLSLKEKLEKTFRNNACKFYAKDYIVFPYLLLTSEKISYQIESKKIDLRHKKN